jgi:hypothetical protein
MYLVDLQSLFINGPCHACIVGESGGNPDDDLHPGSAITHMYASRSLAGDNVSMRIKTSKCKVLAPVAATADPHWYTW